jgi:phosphoribosylformylglycinamidine synthase
MVGLIADAKHVTTQYFKDAGDVIILAGILLGAPEDEPLGASHFLKVIHGRKQGRVPRVDYPRELDLQDAVRELICAGLEKSALVSCDGGLAVALAECCISHPDTQIGATVQLTAGGRLDALLFHEAQSRIVLSTSAANAEAVLKGLKEHGVPGTRLGVVGGERLAIRAGETELAWSVEELRAPWFSSIGNVMGGETPE